jgi:hypothetical protein
VRRHLCQRPPGRAQQGAGLLMIVCWHGGTVASGVSPARGVCRERASTCVCGLVPGVPGECGSLCCDDGSGV